MHHLRSDIGHGVWLAVPSRGIVLAILSCGVYLASGAVSAQVSESAARLQCMACHAGPDRFVKRPETGEIQNVTIRMEAFHEGDHGDTHCLDCHTEGFDLFPHFQKKTYTCMDCHPREDEGAEEDEPYDFLRIQDEFRETVHFTEFKDAPEKCCGILHEDVSPTARDRARAAEEQRFTCEHCHDPHYFKATAHIEQAQLILENDNEPCLECHKDDASGPLADPAEPSMIEAHSYLPHIEMHLEATRCIDCHTSVDVTVAHDLPEGMGADQGCNSCHSVSSVLMERLYRYEEKPERTLGFRNAVMLSDGYTMGAHRHVVADWATYIAIGVSVAVIALHGGLRLRNRQRRRSLARSQRGERASESGGAK